jgi:hypothetical protein
MFDYLQQFNKLPKDLRSKISEKEVMSKVGELEKKYQVDLAALIMKVMVKQVPYKNIALYLVGEKDLNEKKAEELAKKLKENVFKDVSDYLEGKETRKINNQDKKEEINEPKNIDRLEEIDKKEDPQELINQIAKKEDYNIKIDEVTKGIIDKVDVSLSSGYLHDRLHMVLRTYIKGVRDKIATRSALARSGQEGGLSLDDANIDKLLKLADEYKKSQEPKVEKPKPRVSEEAEKIDKLDALNDTYSLKDSLKAKEEEKKKEEEGKEGQSLEQTKKEEKEANKEDVPKEEYKESREEQQQVEEKEEKGKEKEKEDLYKKLHIQREIAPPPPSTVVNKEEKEVETHKEEEPEEKREVKNPQEDKKEGFKEEKEVEEKEEDKEKAQDVKGREESVKQEKEVEEKKENIKEEKEVETKEAQADEKKSFKINNVSKKERKYELRESPQEANSPASLNLNQAPANSGKKSMQDIQVSQRIMGPVDELRYFNLKNFRRLSSDPQEAFETIRKKVDLLAKDSYEKRVEGIQAWRGNPLNRLYHQITTESLNQVKPINEIIKQRQEANMDFLSSEELKALIAFNKSFMF